MLKYIPDTYDYNLISDKFGDMNNFIMYQKKYKTLFERYLNTKIDLEKIEEYIQSQDVYIPRIKDEEYNIYHQDSKLPSGYIYVRNNYHIENLSTEKIERLKKEEIMDEDFFLSTFQEVLFEKEEKVSYGTPLQKNILDSDSIVFEFAYNLLECKDINQIKKIDEIIDHCFIILEKEILEKTSLKSSFLIYNSLPDIFIEKEEKDF